MGNQVIAGCHLLKAPHGPIHLTCLFAEEGLACACECDVCRGNHPLDSSRLQATKPAAHDPVNRPSHYTSGKIEVIDFIEDQQLGFHLGNCVKYVARAGKKDPTKEIEDLEKGRWYLNRKIEQLKRLSGSKPT